METRSKKARTRRVSWLNLHTVILDINVRKMIYAYLTPQDRLVVECAHNSKKSSFAIFTPGLAIPYHNLAEYCAQHGYFSLLQWTLANGFPMTARVSCFAAYGGHLEVLRWLRDNGCPLNSSACYYAEKHNHVEVLAWLQENGCVCGNRYH